MRPLLSCCTSLHALPTIRRPHRTSPALQTTIDRNFWLVVKTQDSCGLTLPSLLLDSCCKLKRIRKKKIVHHSRTVLWAVRELEVTWVDRKQR